MVNGNLQTASASGNASWSGPFLEKTVTVNLQAGNNSLRIQGGGGGSFGLDRLCVDGGTGGGGCTPPALSLGTPACNGTSTYLVDFNVQAGASVSSSAGSVQGNYVVNIPVGTNVAITASLNGCSTQLTANSPTCNSGGNPPGSNTLTKVRYFFRNDGCGVCRDRCAQSQIQGSIDNVNWTTLAVIPFLSDGWNEVNISTSTTWRYLRYQASGGCYGELMELEFYNGATKLSGTPFGSPGVNASMDYISAFDGNLGTLWHGNQPGTQNFAGLDLSGGANPPPPASGCGTGSGLTGFYTNTTDLSDYLVLIRNDAQINFSWGNSSPEPGTVIADGFSVRWFGQVEAPVSGNYTFKTNNDDGTRLWVNGQTIIDDWNGHAPTWQQGSIYLNAGQKYDIEMDFVDYWGGAQAQLYWEYPGQGTQIVPSCRLYPKITAKPLNSSAQTNIGPSGQERVCYYEIGCVTYRIDCKTGKVLNLEQLNCDGGGSGGGGDPAGPPPGPVGPTSPISPGGGYPGVPGGPPRGPFRPKFALQLLLSKDEFARRNFYTAMQNKGIYFTADEVAVLNEYPPARDNVLALVNAHGSKPDGSNTFILSDADQQRYPKFANLVRSLPDFVENDEKVKAALIQYTGYSLPKLKALLKFGQGPRIYLVDNLTDRLGKPVLGLCDCDVMDKPSESKIQIKENYVQGFEIDNGSLSRRRAGAFLLAVTVLHEFVHYSRNQNQLNDFSFEFGDTFELQAFGVRIGPNNAGQLSYRLIQIK